MLILFADKERSEKVDRSGFNKIGYVTQSRQVIFPFGNRVIRKDLPDIEKFPHTLRSLPGPLEPNNVEKFFLENHLTLDLFNLGVSFIARRDAAYFSHPIKLPRLEPIDKHSRTERWVALKAIVTKADLLFTFDSRSVFSKVIAMVDDKGPWSHCASCTGEGTVIEAIASSVCERAIDIYADPKYRLGLYRPTSPLPESHKAIQREHFVQFQRSQIGKPYSYRKAAITGLRKVLGLRPSDIRLTPNELAIRPELRLISYV